MSSGRVVSGRVVAIGAGCIALLAGVNAAVSSARTSPTGSGRSALAKPKPVPSSTPPAKVSAALTATQSAGYLILNETTQTGTTRYVLDSRDGRAEVWVGRSVSLIQIGRVVFSPRANKGCYISSKRSSPLLPNVAGMLLPSGISALHYAIKGHTIDWSIKTSAKYQPHGSVKVNKAGRIVAARIFSGPGVPLSGVVTYPVKAPKIVGPKKLCAK